MQSEGDSATACLLFFYAAECGLKERLLHRGSHRDTSALERTHDMRSLAKALNLPRHVWAHLHQLNACHLRSPGYGRQARVALAELHEAWRYGAKIHEADEKAAGEALRAVIAWCERG